MPKKSQLIEMRSKSKPIRLKSLGRSAAAMKSSPTSDDCDDIFGPPRTYPGGYCPPKNRPSMISAKYRQKEERRKVLKISFNKLKKIEDPEASLCRSVLINNTLKRLQKEVREEKVQKQQLNYPRCYDNDNFLNIKSEFMKNESKCSGFDDAQLDATSVKIDFVEPDFDAKLAQEIETVNSSELLSGLVEENLNKLASPEPDNNNLPGGRFGSRKRSFDDIDECNIQDVLSQFYMPPTPRMLTCIDDDEDVNVVDDDEPASKRQKLDDPEKIDSFSVITELNCDKTSFSSGVNSFVNNNVPQDMRLRYGQGSEADANPYSCGHASMFSELQNNVYHNLIASLET